MKNLNIYILLFTLFISNNIMSQKNGMQLDEYKKIEPQATANLRYYYGDDKNAQFADLYLPQTKKDIYPVVAIIHGGCWDSDYQGLRQMGAMVDSLLSRGFAVWNIEYRCVDYTGGGYPGTYKDIRNALFKLDDIANKYAIDADNKIVVGHSAGGHLAIWSAKSNAIESPSLLHSNRKLKIKAAIGLGSILDLQTAEEACPSILKHGGVNTLIEEDKYARAFPLQDTSPAAMNQTDIPIVLIHGAKDNIAPPRYAVEYLNSIHDWSNNTTPTTVIIVPDATHYDEVSPTSSVWHYLLGEINKATFQ